MPLTDTQEIRLTTLFAKSLELFEGSILTDYQPALKTKLTKFISSLHYDCRDGVISFDAVEEIAKKLYVLIKDAMLLNRHGATTNGDDINTLLSRNYGSSCPKTVTSSWGILLGWVGVTFGCCSSTLILLLLHYVEPRAVTPATAAFIFGSNTISFAGFGISLARRDVPLRNIEVQLKQANKSIYSFFSKMNYQITPPASEVSSTYWQLANKIEQLVNNSAIHTPVSADIVATIRFMYTNDAIAKEDILKGRFIQRLLDIYVSYQPLKDFLTGEGWREEMIAIVETAITSVKTQPTIQPVQPLVQLIIQQVDDEIDNHEQEGYRLLPV